MIDDKLVRFVFTHEDDIRRAVFESRNDRHSNTTGGCSGHSRISDPTAMTAINNVTPLAYVMVDYGSKIGGRKNSFKLGRPELWLAVVDTTYKFFDGKKQGQVLDAKFRSGECRACTCTRLGIKKSWYSVLLADALEHATRLAKGQHLLW